MTTAPTLGRRWDAFDVYLFDIDGTLLNCTDATHYFAFCNALQQVSGRPLTLEGVVTHGNTDVGILRDALQIAAVPESAWRPRIAEMCVSMGAFVEQRQAELRPVVLPCVPQMLQHLQPRARLGVATGNLERVGTLKLAHAGLLPYFQFGGWSDGHEDRSSVFRAAIAKARSLFSSNSAICVLGDTPADIRAAHANHVPIIAVATGIFTFDQLTCEAPELCLHSFADLF